MISVKRMLEVLGVPLLALTFALASVQANDDDPELQAMLAEPRPIDAISSYWIEELTWMEVRDAIRTGTTTAIIPTGGIEQNGPYLATGKHNIIMEEICPEIAADLGNALCAPVVGFVPEGSINPPTGHMHFPGTISVRESTFVALLTDMAMSLAQHGFTDIVLIGDSGGNQNGLRLTAEAFNDEWAAGETRAHYLEAFYEPGWTDTEQYAADKLNLDEPQHDGLHDDIYVTSMMMASNIETVRHAQRLKRDLASINGIDISDAAATAKIGEQLILFRAQHAARAIEEMLSVPSDDE